MTVARSFLIKIVAMMLIAVMACAFMTNEASAASTRSNTFTVYSSSTYKAVSAKNVVVMSPVSVNAKSGFIRVSGMDVKIKGYTLKKNTNYWYYWSGSMVYLYAKSPVGYLQNSAILKYGTPGRNQIGSARVTFSSSGKGFYNIIKLDSMGGGYYFKY